jgi:hypothetical protein
MALSIRHFLLTDDGAVLRLPAASMWRMVQDPDACRLPDLAGLRVREVTVVVEVDQGVPLRTVRSTYAVLSFDNAGRLDGARFRRQQFARAEAAFDRALSGEPDPQTVVDASSRFVAQGGTWTPTAQQRRKIEAAALDRWSCKRVRIFRG